MKNRALTLLEVILALGIMSIGIALSLELLGRLTANNTNATLTLEQRMLQARQLVDQADFSQAKTILEKAKIWQVAPDTTATLQEDTTVSYPHTLALEIHLLDSNQQVQFSFPMLKNIDPQPR